jgi:hypothetical protein
MHRFTKKTTEPRHHDGVCDERVEGASGKPPGVILLDVDQVDQVTPVRPLVEPHGGVALFDELD